MEPGTHGLDESRAAAGGARGSRTGGERRRRRRRAPSGRGRSRPRRAGGRHWARPHPSPRLLAREAAYTNVHSQREGLGVATAERALPRRGVPRPCVRREEVEPVPVARPIGARHQRGPRPRVQREAAQLVHGRLADDKHALRPAHTRCGRGQAGLCAFEGSGSERPVAGRVAVRDDVRYVVGPGRRGRGHAGLRKRARTSYVRACRTYRVRAYVRGVRPCRAVRAPEVAVGGVEGVPDQPRGEERVHVWQCLPPRCARDTAEVARET